MMIIWPFTLLHQDADHKFLSAILPEDRDVVNREFRTNNLLDMLQIQVGLS